MLIIYGEWAQVPSTKYRTKIEVSPQPPHSHLKDPIATYDPSLARDLSPFNHILYTAKTTTTIGNRTTS